MGLFFAEAGWLVWCSGFLIFWNTNLDYTVWICLIGVACQWNSFSFYTLLTHFAMLIGYFPIGFLPSIVLKHWMKTFCLLLRFSGLWRPHCKISKGSFMQVMYVVRWTTTICRPFFKYTRTSVSYYARSPASFPVAIWKTSCPTDRNKTHDFLVVGWQHSRPANKRLWLMIAL